MSGKGQSKSWYKISDKSVELYLYIVPNARKTQLSGLFGEPPRIKIKISEPACDGRANRALLLFLSKTLSVPKTTLTIARGEMGRQKDVICQINNPETMIDKLNELENLMIST